MTNSKLPIKRYQLAGRRRIVLYLTDVAEMANITTEQAIITLKTNRFREGIDYSYDGKQGDIVLSLGTAQSVMLLSQGTCKSEQVWDAYHAITDFLLKGFQK